jgi:hypothetical protein
MIRIIFGNEPMSDIQIKEWFKQFKSDRTEVESDPHSGSPPTVKILENVKRVRIAIYKNHHSTV